MLFISICPDTKVIELQKGLPNWSKPLGTTEMGNENAKQEEKRVDNS
jgi:hypothetical protein